MTLNAKQVSERLGIRNFLGVCTFVDKKTGVAGTRFDILNIEEEEECLSVVIKLDQEELAVKLAK